MSEVCLVKLKARGYCKATVNISSEVLNQAKKKMEEAVEDSRIKKEYVMTGTSVCDKIIVDRYIKTVYDNGEGEDPLGCTVKTLAFEIGGNQGNYSDCEICLLYSENSRNGLDETKQRWHRDIDMKPEKSFPLIIYVPIGDRVFEIGIIPSNKEFDQDLKMSSQRLMKVEPGEIFIMRGDCPHREISNPGVLCLRYTFDIRERKKMIPVKFKVFKCCVCGKNFSSEGRWLSCQNRCNK